MASEKTPLLVKEKQKNEVVVKIPMHKMIDENNNSITTCLTYEELLPFIIDPSWIRLRKISFTSCLIAFVVIFITACISSFNSMSRVACVSPMATSGIDNAINVEQNNATNMDGTKSVLSIVLNALNGTITT